MGQANTNQIPVTLVTLFTWRQLAQVTLPALPVAGDGVYAHGQGYEVSHCQWSLAADGAVEIAVVLQPQIDESGERPVFFAEITGGET